MGIKRQTCRACAELDGAAAGTVDGEVAGKDAALAPLKQPNQRPDSAALEQQHPLVRGTVGPGGRAS